MWNLRTDQYVTSLLDNYIQKNGDKAKAYQDQQVSEAIEKLNSLK